MVLVALSVKRTVRAISSGRRSRWWRPSFRICMGYRVMKAREEALRIKRFEADENAKKVANLEFMIADFQAMATDLDRQILAEEERTGVKDSAHFAYSTFAKSATHRRNNLRASTVELRAKLEAALKVRNESIEQQSDAIAGSPRENQRPRRRPERPISAALR